MFSDPKASFESFWKSVVVANIPGATFKYKDESWLMRFLGKILFFNKSFMTSFITTIGNTVYFPSKAWLEGRYESATEISAHEFIHMWDRRAKRMLSGTDWFSLSYLSPQLWCVGSLLSLFAFVSPWFLLFLLFLVFVVPIPSPWRTYWEANGYAMSMIFESYSQGVKYDSKEHATRLASYFVDSSYYWMCRDKNKVVEMLLSRYKSMQESHDGVKEVVSWLKTPQR